MADRLVRFTRLPLDRQYIRRCSTLSPLNLIPGIRVPNPKRETIFIVNAPEGCRETCSLAHARRYKRKGLGEFTADGKFRFYSARERKASAAPQLPIGPQHESTVDARPGWPILPPSSEWLDAMGY